MQRTFSDLEYGAKKKVTRRDRFLAEIEAVTPWAALAAQIESFYPNGVGKGRPPIGLPRMLRMYVAQQCFGPSDEGMEDAIYDSQTIHRDRHQPRAGTGCDDAAQVSTPAGAQ